MPPVKLSFCSVLLGAWLLTGCGDAPVAKALADTAPIDSGDSRGSDESSAETIVASEVGTVVAPAQDGAQASRGGPQIFAELCAMCHGDSGDGNGLVKFDKPARSFVDGGFSFGNTPEALFRTVSSGIGGTPMPGFKDVLDEDERRAVVAHVIALGPEPVAVNPGSTVMTVTDKPLVARGSFPPIREGELMTPRGLLVGGLDGLSFQYDLENVRLLAVRQGGFVDRRDWQNRGGDTLEPLGEVVFHVDGATEGLTWGLNDLDIEASTMTGEQAEFQSRLVATEVSGGKAFVEYGMYLRGEKVAVVREHAKSVSLGGWSGFRRTFEIQNTGAIPVRLVRKGLTEFDAIVLSQEPGFSSFLHRGSDGTATICLQRSSSLGVITELTSEPVVDKLTVDMLFGLEPTPENLAALKEAL
jgi:mono/diheme cytochrome c family protein